MWTFIKKSRKHENQQRKVSARCTFKMRRRCKRVQNRLHFCISFLDAKQTIPIPTNKAHSRKGNIYKALSLRLRCRIKRISYHYFYAHTKIEMFVFYFLTHACNHQRIISILFCHALILMAMSVICTNHELHFVDFTHENIQCMSCLSLIAHTHTYTQITSSVMTRTFFFCFLFLLSKRNLNVCRFEFYGLRASQSKGDNVLFCFFFFL